MIIRNFIGGKWIDAHAEKNFKSLNPADRRRIVAEAPLSDREDIDRGIDRADTVLETARMRPIRAHSPSRQAGGLS